MAIGYSPRRPDAVIGTTELVLKLLFFASWITQIAIDFTGVKFCQIQDRSSPFNKFTWALALSYRKEIPTKRYMIDGEKIAYALPLKLCIQLQNVNCTPFLNLKKKYVD